MFRLAIAILVVVTCSAPDKPKPLDRAKTENSNALIKEHKNKLAVTASTFWQGWEPEKLIDDNLEKSWFSAKDDNIAINKDKEKAPWVKIEFPRDEVVNRVTIYGNREKPWEKDYSVLSGKLELFDADGKVLFTKDDEGKGDHKDFDFLMEKPIKMVRAIRFVVLGDEGDKNPCRDVALGEIRVE